MLEQYNVARTDRSKLNKAGEKIIHMHKSNTEKIEYMYMLARAFIALS